MGSVAALPDPCHPDQAPAVSDLVRFGVIGGWVLLLAAVAGLGVHRVMLAAWALRSAPNLARTSDVPFVTVQIPLFNERAVAARVIDAAAGLRWPRDRFELQVLDDSTDSTRALVDRAADAARASGTAVEVVRRATRTGFKAGALAQGLGSARGEVLLLLDADFVPHADLVERLVAALGPGVACAQARWGHRNLGDSWLTRSQGTLLDAHFVLEHRGRSQAGLWFNFNGTAGAWRRDAIERAGGWRSDTLVEDLDLSYRAWLSGQSIVYLDDVVVPAELPRRMAAFRAQQFRWAAGGIQVARRLLPAVWRAPVPLRVRVEATTHLLGNLGYVSTLGLALISPMVAMVSGTSGLPRGPVGLLGLTAVVPLLLAYAVAIVRARSGHTLRRLVELPTVLALGAGLCVAQARAVWAGWSSAALPFERTPKDGDATRPTYSAAVRGTGRSELVLAAWQGVGLAWAWHVDVHVASGLMGVLGVGLGIVGVVSMRDHRRERFAQGGGEGV